MAKTYLEPEEVAKLEGAAGNLRDKLLTRLLFRLGCRVSEALAIGLDDVDFKVGTITIQHLKVRIRLSCPECGMRLAKTAKFCPGCGSKVDKVTSEASEHHRKRVLPVDADTLMLIKEYVKRGGPVEIKGKKQLFEIKRRRAAEIIAECARKAGLGRLVNPETGEPRGISPHRLRDAFAVMAVKRDDSADGIRLLQEHLGHQSIITTMKYRKVSGEEQKEWYGRIWNKDANQQ